MPSRAEKPGRSWLSFATVGLSLTVVVWAGVTGSEVHSPPCSASADHPMGRAFTIITEQEAKSEQFGMLMMCPAHAHGTPEQAVQKLQGLLREKRADVPSTIWVCREFQVPTLQRFAPMVDRVVINPFAGGGGEPPSPGEQIWGNYDHPIINHLRAVRAAAGEVLLIGCIDADEKGILFRNRRMTFEEYAWEVLALVGGNYQGLVLRKDQDNANWLARLDGMLAGIRAHAQELGRAHPVGWVSGPPAQPLSSLCSRATLFVVLLNPEYMVVKRDMGVFREPALPLASHDHAGEITISLPAGRRIESATALSGRPVRIVLLNSVARVPYTILGGGEMLTFQLSGEGSVTATTRVR